MGKVVKGKTSRGRKQDRFGKGKSHHWRYKELHERGRGAKRKGNPRYKPVIRNGRKVYIVRPGQGK